MLCIKLSKVLVGKTLKKILKAMQWVFFLFFFQLDDASVDEMRAIFV